MTSSCLKTELSYLFLLTLYSSSAYGCTPNQTIIIILIECRPFKQSLTSKNRKLYQLPLYYPSSFKFQLNVSDSSPTRFKCGQFSLCTHLVQSDRPFIIFKFTKTDMRHPRSPFFQFSSIYGKQPKQEDIIPPCRQGTSLYFFAAAENLQNPVIKLF